MVPNEKFKFEATTRGEKKVIVLKGIIDEDTTFDQIKKLGGPYVFNFGQLTSINSCGVRSWVNFLKELGAAKIFYEDCPPLVVRQMNMVPSFTGSAQVLSVFVPFVCDNCESEKWMLLDSDALKSPESQVQQTIQCESCTKGEMAFDGHPKQYFAFRK